MGSQCEPSKYLYFAVRKDELHNIVRNGIGSINTDELYAVRLFNDPDIAFRYIKENTNNSIIMLAISIKRLRITYLYAENTMDDSIREFNYFEHIKPEDISIMIDRSTVAGKLLAMQEKPTYKFKGE